MHEGLPNEEIQEQELDTDISPIHSEQNYQWQEPTPLPPLPETPSFAEKKDKYQHDSLEHILTQRAEYPALERTLEAIDFSQLKGLFLERIMRTTSQGREYLEEHMQFAERERIVPITRNSQTRDSLANAHVDKMLITVNAPALPPPLPPTEATAQTEIAPELLETMQRKIEAGQRLSLFHTLVHEETHITASEIPDEVYEVGENVGYRTGFEYGIGGGVTREGAVIPAQGVLNRSFNEGVTEKIAREISAEYIKRHGVGELQSKDWDSYVPRTYEKECLLVESLTNLAASHAGVPDDVVWGGITEAYFSGTKNGLRAIASAYGEAEQEDVLARLSHLSGVGYPTANRTVDEELRALADLGKLSPDLVSKINLIVSVPPPLPPE